MVLQQEALVLPQKAILQHQVLLAEVLLEWVLAMLLKMVLLVVVLKPIVADGVGTEGSKESLRLILLSMMRAK